MFSQALEQELLAWQNAAIYDFNNSHYKCVYVVQKYDLEGNYDCAVFSIKDFAINYAKNSYNEMMKPYIKMYKKDKVALDYISKTEGYSVIMFILDAILDNKKIIFDTSDMTND